MATKLAEYLEKRDLSVRAFGALAGISSATVSRVQRGGAPSIEVAYRIIQATKNQVKLADLIVVKST